MDDDQVNLDLSSMWLQSYGVSVETASDGKMGQKILKTKEVDLVLADLQMPEWDGVRFLQWLREKKKDSTPVIICSAESVENILAKVNRSGANGFLPKPYNQEELLGKIAPFLGIPYFSPTKGSPTPFLEESPPSDSHMAYAVQKLHQELNGKQKAVDKKIRLLIKVGGENIAEIQRGLNKKDRGKVNREIHKMLMICLYLGKEFVQQQADLDEMTKESPFTSETQVAVEAFISKVGAELQKLEGYTNYSTLNQ